MYFDTKMGKKNLTTYSNAVMIIISSSDTPASINFKFDIPSDGISPI